MRLSETVCTYKDTLRNNMYAWSNNLWPDNVTVELPGRYAADTW